MGMLKKCPYKGAKGLHMHRTRRSFLKCKKAHGPKQTWS